MSTSPPGPQDLPLLGNTHRYSRDPFSFIETLTRSYNGLSTFTLGTEQTYLVTEPKEIERILVSEDSKFRKSQTIRSGSIDDLLGDGLLMSGGDFWQRQRQRAQPAFAPSRVMNFGEEISEYAETMLSHWNDGEVVKIDPAMARITVKVIVSVMFGTELDDQTTEKVQNNLEPLGKMFEPKPAQFLLPEWVPTPERVEFENAVDNLEEVLDTLVYRRKGTEDGEMDLLSILLRAQSDVDEVTEELVRDELMTMLLAGHDTTALSLTYTWYLLSQHPEIERRVHDEIDEILGNESPTASDVRDLDLTERVIQEAMRLYPPVYTIFREPTEPIQLGGYRIPKGALVMLPQWGVHRDPRWYDDPESFDPDRWTTDRASERPNYSYFPFGGGPRHCIGKHLSMLEAQIILATVAQNYRLRLAPEQSENLDFAPSLTMHPSEPIQMQVQKR
ncbi:cytochrome P450 [Halococcus sp. PRR34]|uniref:cytochrome P450 n=1 Tax=Halococcus sp. PRR34 TaxID=3020830 RepID=UPI002360915E|nr:cytochrome P450 [Halococcus sp. PRR34]